MQRPFLLVLSSRTSVRREVFSTRTTAFPPLLLLSPSPAKKATPLFFLTLPSLLRSTTLPPPPPPRASRIPPPGALSSQGGRMRRCLLSMINRRGLARLAMILPTYPGALTMKKKKKEGKRSLPLPLRIAFRFFLLLRILLILLMGCMGAIRFTAFTKVGAKEWSTIRVTAAVLVQEECSSIIITG